LRFLLFPFRALLVIMWVLAGLLSVTLVFPFIRSRTKGCMNYYWSRALMALCGVATSVQGQPVRDSAVLWVANHVSWVDIFVLNSVRPTSFIAKSEIRSWPVIGWLVAGAGTVFIERGRRHAVRAVGHEMKKRFDNGEVVGLFPEGTTSAGYDVAPFHSSLFDAAIRAQVDIQPVALLFYHQGKRSDGAAFVGEQNLVQNLWFLLTNHNVGVTMVFLPVLSAAQCAALGRAETAAVAMQMIRERVVKDVPSVAAQGL
jgi:1-acyl-sn-glycerol-3-phosphate acyltransferase